MKKFLSLLLVFVFCMGCFVGCTPKEDETTTDATLADAVTYLKTLYKDAAESTPRDYDMPAKVMIGTTSFTVTWNVNVDSIKVKESSRSGFWTIDLPDVNETEFKYVLTATVKDAAGKTEDISFDRSMPVVENPGTTNPEADKEYKLFMTQVTVGKVLYATTETQDGKYLMSTEDADKAAIFKTEEAEGGYKIYTEIDGKKSYIYAYTVPYDDGSGKMSKYLCYSEENSSVWTYQQNVNAWFTVCADGATYVMGTYNNFETFCISESTFITEANTGKTQFPAELLEKGKNAPSIPGGDKDMTPEEIVDAAYALEVGGTLAGMKTLTGVITSVDTAYDSGYQNVTVTIVVGNKTDKPIQCFRLKGDGADKIGVGDTITVTGSIINYDNGSEKGKVEFNSGCTLDSYTLANGEQGGTDTPTNPPATNDQPAAGATALSGALTNGMKIVIVNVANKKALSSDPSSAGSFYQKGVNVTITGNTVSGYGTAEIWTVVDNGDGTFSFQQGNQKLGMQNEFASMSLGSVNDKWEVIALDGGLYNIKNTVRGNFIEWYASKDNWSTYSNGKEATDPLFQMGIYVVE